MFSQTLGTETATMELLSAGKRSLYVRRQGQWSWRGKSAQVCLRTGLSLSQQVTHSQIHTIHICPSVMSNHSASLKFSTYYFFPRELLHIHEDPAQILSHLHYFSYSCVMMLSKSKIREKEFIFMVSWCERHGAGVEAGPWVRSYVG